MAPSRSTDFREPLLARNVTRMIAPALAFAAWTVLFIGFRFPAPLNKGVTADAWLLLELATSATVIALVLVPHTHEPRSASRMWPLRPLVRRLREIGEGRKLTAALRAAYRDVPILTGAVAGGLACALEMLVRGYRPEYSDRVTNGEAIVATLTVVYCIVTGLLRHRAAPGVAIGASAGAALGAWRLGDELTLTIVGWTVFGLLMALVSLGLTWSRRLPHHASNRTSRPDRDDEDV